jgi:glycosyltransferase involved in cell wall biosynthesis
VPSLRAGYATCNTGYGFASRMDTPTSYSTPRRRGENTIGRLSCAIVHHDSNGQRADAAVLTQAIRYACPKASIVTWRLDPSFNRDYRSRIDISQSLRDRLPFDVLFLLEHAHSNHPFLSRGFARRTIYIPNIEWMSPRDEEVLRDKRIDTVIFKNKFSANVFSAARLSRFVSTCAVTGWTSGDVSPAGYASDRRKFNSFLHIRGAASQKKTEIVLNAWLRNPSFPPLTIASLTRDQLSVPVPLKVGKNIVIHMKALSKTEVRALQRENGIHVYPSCVEGFGHALNEARSAGAVLITSGGPPMNDFVTHGSTGFLVPVHAARIRRFNRSYAYPVTTGDLIRTVRRLLAVPVVERHAMGKRAREAFEQEAHQFRENIRSLIM